MEAFDSLPHEAGPLFDDDESIQSFVEEVTGRTALEGELLENAVQRARTVIDGGESFASWLAKEVPDVFGGDKTLDPLTAYELLQTIKYGATDSDEQQL